MLKVIEAFAGVGSQRMALKRLKIDFKVVGIFETDKYALKAYEAIHGECNNLGDISKIKIEDVPDHDLFTYSFPCQDLSVAGKQRGLAEGTRSSLLYECKKIIEAKKPKYLLLENVKNLVGKRFKEDFDNWLKYLESLGYNNYWKVLNAKDYGIPQNRERVFVVSILKEHDSGYSFPTPIPLNKTIFDYLENDIEDRYRMSEKCIEKMNRYMPKNDVEPICPTLTTELAHGTGKNLYPKICKIINKYRQLTPLECWRLMSFTDEDFFKAKNAGISNTQLYKQAGNSIVVKVLEEIFKNLLIDNEQIKK
jgi:DNA (cytosine-5)-methyltransferase 1